MTDTRETKGPGSGQRGDRPLPAVANLSGGVQLDGGSRGGGQSAGGPYPNPHSGKTERGAQADDKAARTNEGYHGGGQQGGRNWSGRDHHAASKGSGG